MLAVKRKLVFENQTELNGIQKASPQLKLNYTPGDDNMSLKETSFKIKASQFLSYLVLFSKLFFAFAGVVSVLENGSRAPGTTSID